MLYTFILGPAQPSNYFAMCANILDLGACIMWCTLDIQSVITEI